VSGAHNICEFPMQGLTASLDDLYDNALENNGKIVNKVVPFTTEELFGRNSSSSGLESREYGRKDSSR
jgi:hypothetical protein